MSNSVYQINKGINKPIEFKGLKADPSIKAQAAATGLNTAKALISKKARQIKVMVKAGYKVLLKDQNIQQ